MIRELDEEIGVKVRILRKLSDYEDYRADKLFGVYSGYEVEIIEGQPFCREPHKISELRYFPLNALPENIAPYTLEYIKALRTKE